MARDKNAEVLKKLSEEELEHYRTLAEYTRIQVRPRRWSVFLYLLVARVFGLTFALQSSRLMGLAGSSPGWPSPSTCPPNPRAAPRCP